MPAQIPESTLDAVRTYPISQTQKPMWFLYQLEPHSSAYNIATLVHICDDLDVPAMEQAFQGLVDRHEVFRSTFSEESGQPVQHVYPFRQAHFEEIDASAWDEAHLEAQIDRVYKQPIDLTTGPLLRAKLFTRGAYDHMLVVIAHHIVVDGWSLWLIIEEISELYAAAIEGRASSLREMKWQYKDFVKKQTEWLASPEAQQAQAYWEDRLSEESALLNLPTDHPRHAFQTLANERHIFQIDADTASALKEFARTEGTTLYTVLLAAFQVLLFRYTGHEKINIGSPVAGRGSARYMRIIGAFINKVVMQADFSGEPVFRDFLHQVDRTVSGALAHQKYPFTLLAEHISAQRDTGQTPLFQVAFVFQQAPRRFRAIAKALFNLGDGRQEIKLGKAAVKSLEVRQEQGLLDLYLEMLEIENGLHAKIQYNADLFEPETIHRMADQFQTLLAQIVADPNQNVLDYWLDSPEARKFLPDPAKALPSVWTQAAYERFADWAERHPGRVAVADHRTTFTYGQLNACANRLAHHLRGLGVLPGDHVALYGHRSAGLVISLLGVWKAGAACGMLDPSHPPARLLDELGLLNARAFLRMEAAGAIPAPLAGFLEQEGCPIITIPVDVAAEFADQPGTNPERPAAPGDLACVLFTSGTTGIPKGVLSDHGPLSHFLGWHTQTFGLTEKDRFSALSGLGHDPLLRDILAPLWVGASLHIPDPDDLIPGRLAGWMQAQEISVTHLTPAMSQLLTEAAGPAALPGLRYAFFGGDVLRGDHVDSLQELAPHAVCVNFYGATETPQAMGYHQVQEAIPGDVPVGNGIPGVQLLVLNRRGRLAGVGELGEIHIRTPYLSRGYLGDDELTAARFLPNPYSSDPADRMFKSGDLGRYLPDGTVAFCGRRDTQVKIRAFRVELRAVEQALVQHPGVRQAGVVALDKPEGRVLAAFLVSKGEQPPSAGELHRYLRARLPAYMIPASFSVLEKLPLTPNGKVDRQELTRRPAPRQVSVASEEDHIPPRNAVEAALAGILANLLQVERVGIHEHFFELGGHSLQAARFLAQVNATFRVSLPLRAFFEAPTIADLAVKIQQDNTPARQIPRRSPGEKIPLSYSQQRLWFLDRLERGNPAYNIPIAIRLRGSLEADTLECSLNAVLERHESLRTRFVAQNGSPYQIVDPAAHISLPVAGLTALPESERQLEVDRIMREEAGKSFDLAQDRLVRARLLRLDEQEHIFLFTLHHIVADGWSVQIFLRELAACYTALSQGEAPRLPELPIQYPDFAVWQRESTRSEAFQASLAYWMRQLGGQLPHTELPTDSPRPATRTFRGAKHVYLLPRSLLEALKSLAREEDCSLFMALLATFNLLVGRHTGQEDLLIGSPVAGRNRSELEGLIGFFLNTLVLRTSLEGRPTFRELLARVRQVCLSAYDHQDIPFENLLEKLQPARDLSRTPLFQIFFNMLNFAPGAGDMALFQGKQDDVAASLDQFGLEGILPGISGELVNRPDPEAKFDLTLYLSEQKDGLGLQLVYNADLYEAPHMAELLAQFAHLLGQIAANPDRPISEYSLVTENAATVLPDPAALLDDTWQGPIHAALSRQARRVPGKAAVVDALESWTYGELEADCNRLANALIEAGCRPGEVVVVYGHRSAALVWAILGVLKAGCAFVILDPAYPAARLTKTLRLAKPVAWLALEAAGPLPGELQAALQGLRMCITLPASAQDRRKTFADVAASPPPVTVGPDDLAYIAFTSGSTGQPKGVLGRHGSLTHFLPWLSRHFALNEGDRFSMLSGLSHDPLHRDIFTPLWIGAQIDIPDPEMIGSPGYLGEWLNEAGVTVVHLTPAMGQLILDTCSPETQINPLRLAFFVGDSLDRNEAARLQQLAPGLRVINLYGTTETQRAVGYFPIPGRAADLPRRVVPLGKGMPDTQLLVLNEAGQLAGVGESGEIVLRSPHLALGYVDDPAQTEARFLPNPWTETPGDRLYRTGDLGRYLPDGSVVFAGRADRQVKVRGFRIELAEIEAVLENHPAVQTALLVLHQEGSQKRLTAYAIPAQSRPEPRQLREHVQTHLPGYMVPDFIVFLDAFPLTPNGKIDRRALPAPKPGDLLTREAKAPPADELEVHLIRIWERVLGLSPIGVHDNFFDLGGHSLLAAGLFAEINRLVNMRLPLILLFQAPTISQLAAAIRQRGGWQSRWNSLVPIHASGTKRPFFYVSPYLISVLSLEHLGRRLEDHPFYGLQPSGLEENQPVHTTIEEMAAAYIREMRTVQGSGPYFFGGHCSGAWVAMEIAHQLKEQGEEIGALVLVDSAPPNFAPPPKQLLKYLINRAFFYWRDGRLLQALRWKLKLRYARHILSRTGTSQDQRAEIVRRAQRNAYKIYHTHLYQGDATFLRSAESTAMRDKDWHLRWGELVRGAFKVGVVPSTHANLLEEPFVQDLAEKIRAAIEPNGSS